jgi:uncharacterized protein
MKIAVIGAAGKQGILLVKEAFLRGHTVTAVVRKESDKSKFESGTKVIVKNLMTLDYGDIGDTDVIIDAFGTWAPESMHLHKTTMMYLADLVSGKSNRLLIVGGAGSLFVDKEHRIKLLDTPEFPEEYKPVATAMSEAFDVLKKRDDVKWTFVSPPAVFNADGKRTGKYQLGEDHLLTNAEGNSEISYADFAIAMIDEAEKARFVRKHITVCSI